MAEDDTDTITDPVANTDAEADVDAVADPYLGTFRLDPHELVRRLNNHLGATAVALLAGVRDRKLPYRWEKANGPTPRAEAITRLQVAQRIWVRLAAAESDYIVRSWFLGANPRLGETQPVVAIREGRFVEVMGAVDAFLDGTDE